MDINVGPDVIDAILLLYLPKSKVSVIGSEQLGGSDTGAPGVVENIVTTLDTVNMSVSGEEVEIPDAVRNSGASCPTRPSARNL